VRTRAARQAELERRAEGRVVGCLSFAWNWTQVLAGWLAGLVAGFFLLSRTTPRAERSSIHSFIHSNHRSVRHTHEKTADEHTASRPELDVLRMHVLRD
jgi:hypothetical protein